MLLDPVPWLFLAVGTISRNLGHVNPRTALAGKAADDDAGVIYGHNRGSGEKEKEGEEHHNEDRMWVLRTVQ